jgi:hypothetical protein
MDFQHESVFEKNGGIVLCNNHHARPDHRGWYLPSCDFSKQFENWETQLSIFKFVSRNDCAACLFEEAKELKRIDDSFKNVAIRVVTVDSSRTTPRSYREVCDCTFRIYFGGLSVGQKITILKTPYLVIVSPFRQILATYYPEVGNAQKRNQFYTQVRAILASGIQ